MADNSDTGLWFRRYSPAVAAPVRLICFPHAGGSASFFLPFSRSLHPEIEVLAVQYPGRQDRHREPLVDSIADIARRLAAAIVQIDTKPTAFLGHSMGTVVAYETARLLGTNSPHYPLALFASGRRAPSIYRDEQLDSLKDSELISELTRLGGTSSALLQDPEMAESIVRVSRNDYRAIGLYQHTAGPALHCPIIGLAGDADPRVSIDEVRCWHQHTESEFAMHVFPGGHFYLNEQVPEVTQIIRNKLGKLTPTRAGQL
ncbi:thioesterase II family protein [Nocardia sp. NBC_01009]|uniref:thioesterase II family protein n=1 Tax=Nocardia sp. NBC_01009 TaxID=2975996 RepID=UPI003863B312